MKSSKFVRINPNILLEYIYDDNNLIGEPYNVLVNNQTGVNCFISTDQIIPPIRGYVQTNNEIYNQLFLISQDLFARLPRAGNNIISDTYPFLQLKNFSTSIPIRYDKIRIHLPVDYTFGDNKGFFLKVYTFNSEGTNVVELSNYHFDISDVEQNYKLEFASNTLYFAESQWGKYLEVQVPSVTKISDQVQNLMPIPDSINYNLTDGAGLSRTAPIFVEFRDILSVNISNGVKFVNTSTKKTVVFPQTPDFENLGIKVEESTQGDFFLIYATYNGNAPEFVDFIEDSLAQGKKYQVKYIVDLWEETVKTKTYTFSIVDDFAEEVEFRPIFKFTNTVAMIDVTLRLIDINDGSSIERKSSYGLLQGGGQRMGSQTNGRITSGNGSGGGGDICRYSNGLTKINLRNVRTTEVINYRDIVLPAVSNSNSDTRPILTLVRDPFVIFSTGFEVIDDESSHQIQ